MRGPSFTGLGNRPSLTPAHQVDLLTGIGPLGARMDGSRTKPVEGSSLWFGMVAPHLIRDEVDLGEPGGFVAELGLGKT